MLEKLIESTDNGQQSRKMRKFIMGTGTAMSSIFVCGLIFSIFSTNLAMGSQDIDLTRLFAPAAIPDQAPPPPAEKSEPARSDSSPSKLPSRIENIQRLDEVPVAVPQKVSTVKSKFRARPTGPFIVSGNVDSDGSGTPNLRTGTGIGGKDSGSGFVPKQQPEVRKEPAIQTKQTIAEPPKLPPLVKKDITITEGVINGKALRLVQPTVSATVRSLNLKGQVRVDVLISEEGKVMSATASEGHALLKPLAISAARRSTFTPTLLSKQPVKVRGVILYNFN